MTTTEVNAPGGDVKPDGVATVSVVSPAFREVKLAVTLSLPPMSVTGDGIVPTVASTLLIVTANDAPPPARGWVCRKFEFASRSAVFTTIGEGPPPRLIVSGKG